MQAVLYYSNAESTRVDKTDYITLGKNIDILLKDRSSITDPVILLENENIFNYNYISIPRFDRAYFITDVYSVRNNLWEIHCHVDVLYSFRTQIKKLNALIYRQENEKNSYLVDNQIPILSGIDITDITLAGQRFGINNIADKDFQIAVNISTSAYNLYPIKGILTPKTLLSAATLLMTYEGLLNLISNFNSFKWTDLFPFFANPSEAVISINIFPFDLYKRDSIGNYYQGIYAQAGDGDTVNIANAPIILPNDQYVECGIGSQFYTTYYQNLSNKTPFQIPHKFNNFLDYAPFTEIELFLPGFGFVPMDTNLMYQPLYLLLFCDLKTGKGTYILSTSDIVPADVTDTNKLLPPINSSDIIWSQTVDIAVQTPVTSTNYTEIGRNITNGILKIGAAIAGGAVAGAASEDVILASSAQNPTKNINAELAKSRANIKSNTIKSSASSGIDSFMAMKARPSSVSVNGDATKNYVGDIPMFRIRRPRVDKPEEYARFVGNMCNKTLALSKLTGFTVIDKIHLEGFSTALDSELEEIEDLLKSGVIF